LVDLPLGRINRFSLEALIRLAQRAGLTVDLEVARTVA
jgi:predicted XRE-type DNA-binding protein